MEQIFCKRETFTRLKTFSMCSVCKQCKQWAAIELTSAQLNQPTALLLISSFSWMSSPSTLDKQVWYQHCLKIYVTLILE